MSDSKSITVEGHQIEVGSALKLHCREGLERADAKFFNHLTKATVIFSKDGAWFKCSITASVGQFSPMSAFGHDRDAHRSFDVAMKKIETQMRRLKRQQTDTKPVRSDKDMLLREGLTLRPDPEEMPELMEKSYQPRRQRERVAE